MKIPAELLTSMQDEVVSQNRWTLGSLLKTFIADESGRGLTGYGLMFAIAMLIAGIVFGLANVMQPRAFACQACGMG